MESPLTYKSSVLFCCLALAPSLARVTYADNGAIAYAYPMEHVSIDGNLSDWNPGGTRYPIAVTRSRDPQPKSKADFDAWFRVGYNLEASSLYFAVEVVDDSFIVDRSANPEWDQQDRHTLYLDPHHSKRGSCPIAYSATPIRREMGGSEFGWDPQTACADWNDVDLEISRSDSVTVYEYRIVIPGLTANRVVGLDHVIYDKDAEDEGDGRSYVMWGPGSGKSGGPRRCGDLVLLERGSSPAAARGSVHWAAPQQLTGRFARVTSVDHSDLWITAALDSAGQYTAALPAGRYFVDIPDPFLGDDAPVRMDLSRHVEFVLGANDVQVDALELKAMDQPDLLQAKGLLMGNSGPDWSLLDAFTEAMMAYLTIPGVSLGILVDGKLAYHNTYGAKNALTQEPVDEDTIFQAASITKSVFAYLVLRLVDQGVLDLDRPLHEYLVFSELEDDPRYRRMTARHVLSHQTGLPNWGRHLEFEPGTQYGYSGEGYEYLKRVVETATGESVLDLLDREVLAPLEMTHNTYFVREQEMFAKAALGHTYDLPTTNWIINQVGMARSMYTEAREFTRFMLACESGKGLSERAHDEMHRSQVQIPYDSQNPVADWNRSFGLGLLIKESPFGRCYGHGGSNAYFQSLFEYYPDAGVGFVVFANNDMGYELGNALRDFLLLGRDGMAPPNPSGPDAR